MIYYFFPKWRKKALNKYLEEHFDHLSTKDLWCIQNTNLEMITWWRLFSINATCFSTSIWGAPTYDWTPVYHCPKTLQLSCFGFVHSLDICKLKENQKSGFGLLFQTSNHHALLSSEQILLKEQKPMRKCDARIVDT